MRWTFDDFERILAEMRPLASESAFPVKALLWGHRKGGRAKKRMESLFKRLGARKKPYFYFECNGLKLLGDRRDRYARGIAMMPHYEVATAKTIVDDLKKYPGAYIDAGTNMGVLCALVAREVSTPVIAIEPDPETARRAACVFALNGLRNVVLYNAAVGERDGEITFYSAPGRSDAASLVKATVGEGIQEVKVPLLTLDTIAEQSAQGNVGFLKVDVEGYEPQAVRGAEQTIRRDRPNLLYEYHWEIAPKLGWRAEEVRDQIEQYAHYTYNVLHGDDPVYTFPPEPSMGLAVNVWCQRAN